MNITINELSARLNALAATAEIVRNYANATTTDDKTAFEKVMLSLDQITEQLNICAAMGAILDDIAEPADYDSIPIKTH